MPKAGFSVTITAEDKTGSAIDGVNRKLAQIKAPAERVQKSLAKFGELTGITGYTKELGKIGLAAQGAASKIASVITPLGAITSAASIAGLLRLSETWAEFGSQLKFTADRIGIGAVQLQSLQGAAVLAGSSAEAMSKSMEGLSQTVYDAIGGRNTEAAALFSQLSIAFSDATRRALPLTDTLHKVADQVKVIMDKGDPRAALRVMGAFGLDPSLLPLLRQGGAAIDDYMAKAKAFGLFNQAGLNAANRLRENIRDVKLAVEGLSYSIAERLAPAFSPMLHGFANWTASLRDNKHFMGEVADTAKEFSTWLENVDFKGIGRDVNYVAQLFGGWKLELEGLALFMGGRFAWAIAAPFIRVGLLVARVSLAIVGLLSKLTFVRNTIAGLEATGAWVTAGAVTVGGLGYNAATETAEDRNSEIGHRFRAGRPGAYVYPPSVAPNSAQQAATERALYAEAIRLGDSPAQAAAWLSQAKRESSYNPAALNAGHYGLFQWDPERQVNFQKWAGHPITASTPLEQLDFAHYEVANRYGRARQALDENRDYAPGAALGLQDYFEMTDNPSREAKKSVDFARDIMARLPAIAAPIPATAGAPGPAGATGRVDVHIRADDKTRVAARSSGNVNQPKIDGPQLALVGF